MWHPDSDPDVTNSTFKIKNGATLEHCRVDMESTVFLIPKLPLTPSKTYEASVTADGETTTWKFTVSKRPPSTLLEGLEHRARRHGRRRVQRLDGGRLGRHASIRNGSPLSDGPYWKGWDIARGATIKGSKGFLVDGSGSLHKLGGASSVTGGPYWPGWDIARGVDAKPGSTVGRCCGGLSGVRFRPVRGAGWVWWVGERFRGIAFGAGRAGFIGSLGGSWGSESRVSGVCRCRVVAAACQAAEGSSRR